MHCLDHILGKFANAIVNFVDSVALRPQDRVPILNDFQLHWPWVKAGRFFTPANFNASMTFTMTPKEAFLSACNASVLRRVSAKLRTALSKSSTAIVFPSSLISSFSLTVRITCSSSAGAVVAVFDSGRLIFTSGWSFLKVVETTKKIRRMVRISTRETMMMDGARLFRTANFMNQMTTYASRHRRDFRRRWLRRRDGLRRHRDRGFAGSGDATVVTF